MIFNETIKPVFHRVAPMFEVNDIIKSLKERSFKHCKGFTLIDSPSEADFTCNPLLYHDERLLYFSYREEKPSIPPVLLRSEIKRLIREWKVDNRDKEEIPYHILKELRAEAECNLEAHARDKTITTDYIVDLNEELLLQVGNHERDVLPTILNSEVYTPSYRKIFLQNMQVDWHLFLQWVLLQAFVREGCFVIESHDSWQNIYVTMGDKIEYGDKFDGRISVNFGFETFKTTRAWAAPLLEGKQIQQMAFHLTRDQRGYQIILDKDFHIKSLTVPSNDEWQQQPEHIKAAQRFSAVMEAHKLLADVMEHFMIISEQKDFMKDLFDLARLDLPPEPAQSEEEESAEDAFQTNQDDVKVKIRFGEKTINTSISGLQKEVTNRKLKRMENLKRKF